jgi:HTH-type transcriptional regulator/antitoxin MqsA
MRQHDLCAVCNQGELIREARDVPFSHKGHTMISRDIRGLWCNHCGEGYFSPREDDDGDRLAEEAHEFVQAVDNMLARNAAYVASVRKKLGLDQREAAALFGGGVNAFSRYETGKIKPPRSLLKLFALLDRHPELIDEIKQETAETEMPQEFQEKFPDTQKRPHIAR